MTGPTVEQQFIVLLDLCAAGVLIGMVFDFFKAAGKVFYFPRKVTFITDLLVCLLVALTVFQLLFLTNWGEVRLYVFLALLLGLVFYYLLLSRYLSPLFTTFFKNIKNVALKIAKASRVMQDYFHRRRISMGQRFRNLKIFSKENRHDR